MRLPIQTCCRSITQRANGGVEPLLSGLPEIANSRRIPWPPNPANQSDGHEKNRIEVCIPVRQESRSSQPWAARLAFLSWGRSKQPGFHLRTQALPLILKCLLERWQAYSSLPNGRMRHHPQGLANYLAGREDSLCSLGLIEFVCCLTIGSPMAATGSSTNITGLPLGRVRFGIAASKIAFKDVFEAVNLVNVRSDTYKSKLGGETLRWNVVRANCHHEFSHVMGQARPSHQGNS